MGRGPGRAGSARGTHSQLRRNLFVFAEISTYEGEWLSIVNQRRNNPVKIRLVSHATGLWAAVALPLAPLPPKRGKPLMTLIFIRLDSVVQA